MASQSKKAKLKNSHLCKSGLKSKGWKDRLKGIQFYTPSERQLNKLAYNKSFGEVR